VTDARNAPDRLIGDPYVQRAAGGQPAEGPVGRPEAELKHVVAQTGLTLTTRKRKVWVLSVKKAEE
jgi:hypothetical protein